MFKCRELAHQAGVSTERFQKFLSLGHFADLFAGDPEKIDRYDLRKVTGAIHGRTVVLPGICSTKEIVALGLCMLDPALRHYLDTKNLSCAGEIELVWSSRSLHTDEVLEEFKRCGLRGVDFPHLVHLVGHVDENKFVVGIPSGHLYRNPGVTMSPLDYDYAPVLSGRKVKLCCAYGGKWAPGVLFACSRS